MDGTKTKSSALSGDWQLPTRPAAIGLLTIDAVLLAAPLFVRWESWFVFAYIPLLITVVLGVFSCPWGKRAMLVLAVGHAILVGMLAAIFVAAFIALRLPSRSYLYRYFDQLLGLGLRIGSVVLACVGVVVFCAAVWGWIRFFRRGPTVVQSDAVAGRLP
jgi:hypothetical protein